MSGSYSPGNIYIYCGDGKGGYLAPTIIKDEKGKDLAIESASAPAIIDWNSDGKPDLILGFISGTAKVIINKGGFVFGDAQDVLAGGAAIQSPNGGPAVADWDGDGVQDLIFGTGEGEVMFYKGAKSESGYTFAKGLQLLSGTRYKAQTDRSAGRPKPSIVDWNGDGKLDLLVGDFQSIRKEPQNLTKAQIKKRDDLMKKRSEQSQVFMKLYQKLMDKVAKKAGYANADSVPKDKQAEFQQQLSKELQNDPDYKAYIKNYMTLSRELAPLEGTSEVQGHVWVYLRK